MEKPVDDKGNVSAAMHEEHHNGYSGDHKENNHHHNKEHKDELADIEGKEKSTPYETGDAGNKDPGHEKYTSDDNDAGVAHGLNDKMDTHLKHTHSNEGAVMMCEPEEASATHGKHEHHVEHVCPTHECQESPSIHGKHTPHDKDADMTHEKLAMQGKTSHGNEFATVTHEQTEKSATHENATHADEHAGLAYESGERYKTHKDDVQDAESLQETAETPTTHEELTCADTHMDSTSESKENLTLQRKHMHDEKVGHVSHASKGHLPVDGEHRSDVKNGNTPREKSPRCEKHVHDVVVTHGHKHRHDVLHAGTSKEHKEKYRSVDDECEWKKAFSDDNSSRDRVPFSRGSSPDVDTPTQCAISPFSNAKPSKSGSKGFVNAERGPGSVDGNLETPPSTSWAFSARASIAPSKFDHMATLRITYAAYKESNRGKEGVPLSLLPEILESARFMVPPPRDLVPLLQRIDIEYKSGDLVRWSLLQNLALQIERKEARYPSVFIPRPSVVRPNSNSPTSWKTQQRSPARRTHPEDDCPELEPQVYEMMKEIDNHRRKSAKEGNYLAADAAAQRLLELKLFEDNKRRAAMLERHAQEREQAEKAYKGELQERNQLWDERLKNFQKEVVDHAQRLKQQHIAALQHFKEKMVSKTPVKAQWSRELLKQRRIQVYLGKQGKYLEAQEVKQSADRMEQAELQAAIAAFQAELIGKEQTVRVKQQTEMDILLQRAARTREEIRKSRTLDLQRCHQRHKNVMRELAAIQKQEVFRFDQLMQKKVQNPYTGVGFGGQRVSHSPALRARINAPDYSTDDALYSGGEES